MDRNDFLNGLEEALTGEISVRQLRSNLQYYRDYISEEISRGRDEQDVMEELGDPRLIARTIVDAQVASEEKAGYFREESDPSAKYNYREAAEEPERQVEVEYREEAGESYSYRDESGDGYGYRNDAGSREPYREETETMWERIHFPRVLSGWKATAAIAAVIILLIAIISVVFHLAFRILFSPVFWVLLIIWMVWRTWKG